jgi:hypothetical protein
MLLGKRPGRKQTLLTEEKLDATGARLKTSLRISIKCTAHEMSVSTTSAVKLQMYATTNFYLWGNSKDKVQDTNHHTLEELRNITPHKISTVFWEKLQRDNVLHKVY